MKFEDKRTLVISIAMIFLLSFITYRQFKNIGNIEYSPIIQDFPKVSIPSIDDIMTGDFDINSLLPDNLKNQTGKPEELSTADAPFTDHIISEELHISYPSNWEQADGSPEMTHENIEFLMVAYSPSITSPSILAVMKINATDIDSIIQIIKENSLKEEVSMEVLEIESENKEHLLECLYSYDIGENSVSKEKVIISNNYSYLVSIITPEDQKEKIFPVAERIIDSIQIVE